MAECRSQIHNWYRFFCDRQPVTIVLVLDRLALAPDLITNHQASTMAQGQDNLILLPLVEAFYPRPIPCSTIKGYLIICSPYETIFEYFPKTGIFNGIFKRVDDFILKHAHIYLDPLNQFEKDIDQRKG